MISPFALEGEEVFACDRKKVRIGQTRGSTSARVVPEMITMMIIMMMMMTMMLMMLMMTVMIMMMMIMIGLYWYL